MMNKEAKATDNKEIREAIAIFNKASKKYKEAEQERKDAEAAYNAIWDKKRAAYEAECAKGKASFVQFANSLIGSGLEAQEKDAITALKDAEDAAKISKAIMYAASTNVAKTAANVLKKALKDTPEKYSMPTHYKKFDENITTLIGSEFWIEDRYVAYVHFRNGIHDHNYSMFADMNRDGTLNLENENFSGLYKTVDYATLKQEARKAKKLAEKISREYDKIYNAYEAGKIELTSEIRYYLPKMNKYLDNDYRFFGN